MRLKIHHYFIRRIYENHNFYELEVGIKPIPIVKQTIYIDLPNFNSRINYLDV